MVHRLLGIEMPLGNVGRGGENAITMLIDGLGIKK
jgi:hypothetical protein